MIRTRGYWPYSGNRGPGLERALARAGELAAESGEVVAFVVQHSDRISRGAGLEPDDASLRVSFFPHVGQPFAKSGRPCSNTRVSDCWTLGMLSVLNSPIARWLSAADSVSGQSCEARPRASTFGVSKSVGACLPLSWELGVVLHRSESLAITHSSNAKSDIEFVGIRPTQRG